MAGGILPQRPTPGGLLGTGNPGAPSGPQPGQARGIPQNTPGPAVPGVPDPDKLVELFTAYTSGQVTREDLISQLATFSEGEGGILGLLESMEEPQEGQQNGPGVVPPLEEPLDERHQRISQLLQGYGIVPDDADQMSTELNPMMGGREVTQEQVDSAIESYNTAFPDTPVTGNTLAGIQQIAKSGGDYADMSGTRIGQIMGGIPGTNTGLFPGVTSGMSNMSLSSESPVFTPAAKPTHTHDNFPAHDTSIVHPAPKPDPRQAMGGGPGREPVTTPTNGITYTAGSRAPDIRDRDRTETGAPKETGELVYDEETGRMVDSGTWMPPAATGGHDAASLAAAVDANRRSKITPDQLEPDAWSTPDVVGTAGVLGGIGVDEGLGEITPRSSYDSSLAQKRAEYEERKRLEEQGGGGSGGGYYKQTFDPLGPLGTGIVGQPPTSGQVPPTTQPPLTTQTGPPTWDPNQPGGGFTVPGQGGFLPNPGQWGITSDEYKAWQLDQLNKMQPSGAAAGFGALWGGQPQPWMTPTTDDKDGPDIPQEALFDPSAVSDPEYKAWQEWKKTQQAGFGEAEYAGDIRTTPADFAAGEFAYPELTALMGSFTTEGTSGQQGMELGGKLIEAFARLGDARITGQISEADRGLKASIAHFDQIAKESKAKFDESYAKSMAVGEVVTGQTKWGQDIKELTLARTAEEYKQMMQRFEATGYIPKIDTKTGDFMRWPNGDIRQDAESSRPTLEREELQLNQAQLAQKRESDMTQLFGRLVSFGDLTDKDGKVIQGVEAGAETLPGQEFAFTKLLESAELSGRMMTTDASGKMTPMMMADAEGNQVPVDTFAARRYAWDIGVENERVKLESERTDLASERANLDAATAQLGQQLQQDISQGQLAEAIATRQEKARTDERRDSLQLSQLKVNTLLSLAQPATMLFVQRFGLLDDIGAALGIDLSEGATAIPQAPQMVQEGTFPTMRMLQDATEGERQLMLAEVAAAGGVPISPEDALSRIQKWTPGSQPLRKEVITGMGR
jgi:hypothetical protein